MVGLCKIDKEGNPRKIVGCSCVVVKVVKLFSSIHVQDIGDGQEAFDIILDHLKSSK